MAQRRPWEVEDGLWELIEPLLPQVERRFRHPGRRRLDDRKALCGILFVLYTGIPWELLPQELGYGSGMTCWRRLRDWHQAGVWQRLHEVLLAKLNAAGAIDWDRSAADGSHVRALKDAMHRASGPVSALSRHAIALPPRGTSGGPPQLRRFNNGCVTKFACGRLDALGSVRRSRCLS